MHICLLRRVPSKEGLACDHRVTKNVAARCQRSGRYGETGSCRSLTVQSEVGQEPARNNPQAHPLQVWNLHVSSTFRHHGFPFLFPLHDPQPHLTHVFCWLWVHALSMHPENYSQYSAVVCVDSCPSLYSAQSRHAPHDRRHFTVRVPRQCTVHFFTGLDALCSVRIRNRLSRSPRRFSDSTRLGCIQQSRQIFVHSRHGRLDRPRPTLPLVFASQERSVVIESSHVQLLLL